MLHVARSVCGILVALACIVPAAMPSPTLAAETTTLRVLAAASAGEVLEALATRFEASVPGIAVSIHVAGSSTLRRQIEAGAPWDVFVGASLDDAEALWTRGLGDAPSLVARNQLVVCTLAEAPPMLRLGDLDRVERLVIANPSAAPVGRYARQALVRSGQWLRLAPRVVEAEHARHVVATVAAAGADAGIAFASDVHAFPSLRIALVIPDSLYDSLGYWATAANQPTSTMARRFIASLAESQTVWEAYGFDSGNATTTRPAPPERGRALDPLWVSLRVATLATLLASACGLLIAASLARRRDTRAEFVAACVDLPLLLPPTVVGIGLLFVLGPRGPLGRLLLQFDVTVVFTWSAAVVASGVMALPLMVRTARAALESVPQRYAEVASTLGAGPRRIFWSIELPLARRGILAAVLLCFFRCLGEFGATLIVAGNIPGATRTLPLAIYTAVFEGRTHDAWQWVAWIAVVSLSGAWLAQRWTQRP